MIEARRKFDMMGLKNEGVLSAVVA